MNNENKLYDPEILRPMEKKILAYCYTDYTYKEIAEKLNMKTHTVHRHVRDIFNKLHVRNRVKMVMAGLKMGINPISEDITEKDRLM